MKRPKYLAKRKYRANRLLALLMLVSMLMTMFDFSAFSAEEDTTEYSNTLDEWSAQVLWSDNSYDFIKNSDKIEDIPFTLTFSYFLNGASRDYEAGEVRFKVKGIGDIKRNGKIIAETTTTQDDSDWDLEYNNEEDEYTFIYKRSIPQNQMLSGGFQMQWKINSRYAINGYTYTSSPVFSIKNDTEEKSINLKPITLEYTSERDQYNISLQYEKLTPLEYEKVEGGVEVKEYIWYNIVTNVSNKMKARGIYKSDYFVSIDIPDGKSYDDVIATKMDGTPINIVEIQDPSTKETVHGFYLFKDRYNDVNGDQCKFRLGFKQSTMDKEHVTVNTRLVPLFNDESQKITESTIEEKLDDSETFGVMFYDFTYNTYNYSHGKLRNDDGKTIIINDIYNEKTIEFQLRAQTDRKYSSSSGAAVQSLTSLVGGTQTAQNPPTGKYDTFEVIQGDDYIAVLTNGLQLRRLEPEEYSFEYVRIVADEFGYDYDVCISTDIDTPFDDYEVYDTGNTSATKTVRFDKKDVKSMYVKVKGVTGSYVSYVYPAIKFKFNWEEEQKKPISEQINPNGNIANFSFLRLVKANNENFAATDGENYVGSGLDELKERDDRVYNEYLYREVADVKLRSAATSINSETKLDKFKKNSSGDYNSTATSTGKIQSDEEGKLKKFSVYTVLQKGMNVKEALEGITVSGSATGINGQKITDSMFNDNVSYAIRTDSTGRKIVVCDFDFSDNPIESSMPTTVTVNFPVCVTAATFVSTGVKIYSAETYTMVHDEGILKFIGNNLAFDVYDLDNDGNTNEYTAKSSTNRTIGSNIIEWLDAAEKYVKTKKTQSYVHGLEDENVRVDSYSTKPGIDTSNSYYSYRLDLSAGANAVKDIIVFDNIEPESKTVQLSGKDVEIKSEWHGTLRSVDTSQPDSVGIISTVYCSDDENKEYTLDPNDPSANGWTRMNNNGSIWTAPDGVNVRTIAVVYDTKNMSDGSIVGAVQNRLLYSVVNMQSPEITDQNINIVNSRAQNNFDVQYNVWQIDKYQSNTLKSAVTTISLDQAGVDFEIRKYDAKTNNTLTGAKFSVYEDEQCTKTVTGLENISVNNLGIFSGKLPGLGTYYIKETQAPTGYKLRTDVIVINATTSYTLVEIADERMTGTLSFKKKDADDDSIDNLAGAEYQLYAFDGKKIFTDENYDYSATGTTDTFVTDKNGLTITGLPWGSYYLVETKAPDGYELNDKKVHFTISRSGTVSDDEEIIVNVSQADSEKTATLMLTKTDEMTGEPLKNAWYKVQKKVGDEWEDATFPYYSTNASGELRIEGVKFGEYRLVEINAPTGYEINSDTIIPQSVVLDASTAEQTIELTHSDQRKTGSIDLTKYSDTGAYLANARFDLYMIVGEKDGSSAPEGDPADRLVRQGLVTDSNGKIPTVSSLEWGKYYFVETYAPTGYKKTDAEYSPEIVEITAENVDVVQDVKVTDKQIRGSVKLTKYGENPDTSSDEKLKLENAVFVLCDKDGNQLKIKDNGNGTYSYDEKSDNVQLKTDSNGEITVDNLPWGAYYFEEIIAPTGYAIADKVRFTVNANNCLSVQELECEDSLVKCQLTVEKEIDEVLTQFGNPTFIFKIKEIKADNSGQEWLRTIQLNSEKKNGSFTLSVNPGEYTVEEIKVSRYTLKKIDSVSDTTTTDVTTDINNRKATVVFQQSETQGYATLKFTNTLENYDKFNHVVGVNNIIPVQRKITGISVVYNGELIPVDKDNDSGSYTIPKDQLTAKIIYDDGSEEIITDLDKLTPTGSGTDFIVDNGLNKASNEIELNAQYTKDGKTYTTKFYVTIAPLVVSPVQKVVYRVDSGNESYFDKDGKHLTANVVYYSDGAAVSGSYIEPKTLDELKFFTDWSDENGNFVATNERGVKEYLENNKDKTEITLYACVNMDSFEENFDYTGDVQEFIAPISGYYTLETWGAYGGGNSTYAGAGAYVSGRIYLEKGTKLYIYVGEHPTSTNAGWNGGGATYDGKSNYRYYAGGGATDIALQKSDWDSDEHLYSRLIVAGAGGGMCNQETNLKGGNGGSDDTAWAGTNSEGNNYGNGATLSAGGKTAPASATVTYKVDGSFGKGGSSYWNGEKIGAGGGGWYGGGAGGGWNNNGGGAGGSSYAWSTEQPANVEKPLNEYYPDSEYKPNEKYYLSNVSATVRDDFDMTNGDGYARITYINPNAGTRFDYTGDIQTYTAPVSGNYLLEVWGAQGGGSVASASNTYPNAGFDDPDVVSVEGGRGGYTSANVYLNKGQTVYIAVGGKGMEVYGSYGDTNITDGGYNGGGLAKYGTNHSDIYNGGGGGATHIALTKQGDGQLVNCESYQDDVLVVAGGGGGSGYYQHTNLTQFSHHGLGGAGGGLESQGNHDNGSVSHGTSTVQGSTQTASGTGTNNSSVGSFGQGASYDTREPYGSGGGGGWYGGSSTELQGGAGGSGHIKEGLTGQTIAGTETFLSPDGTEETGHKGNGFARITILKGNS
ncbi:MAG: glycine-rich protein [Acutalibacteraceae bacterium]